MVAALMVVLLGCAALAIDVGAMAAKKAELQNGADAAALAIAADCAQSGLGTCQGRAGTTAQTYADANSKTNLAAADAPVLGAGTVDVTARAADASGLGMPTFFAQILGISRVNVSATASAAWGGPYAGTAAVPVTFSECQFDLSGTVQVLEIHGSNSCRDSSSGQIIPGGFGWLVSNTGSCGVTVTLANPTMGSKPGNSEPDGCSPVFASLQNQVILLPVFDNAAGNGANGWFHIKGFAAFQLTGYRFPGDSWNNTGTPSCTGSCFGLIGKFVRYIGPDAQGFTPGGPDLGAELVRLTR
ncbi:hypothetical protein GCM10027090_40680 [Sinomonas soli]